MPLRVAVDYFLLRLCGLRSLIIHMRRMYTFIYPFVISLLYYIVVMDRSSDLKQISEK